MFPWTPNFYQVPNISLSARIIRDSTMKIITALLSLLISISLAKETKCPQVGCEIIDCAASVPKGTCCYATADNMGFTCSEIYDRNNCKCS